MYTLLPHSCHMPRPSCPPPSHHRKTTWSVQILKTLTVQLSPVSHYFLALMPFLSNLSSNALNLCSSLNVKVQVYVLITITTNKSTCRNINSDVSCVFYMILRHAEGGWRKAKVTTNQHLSCNLKTSRC
jgi:hypothetical protein